MKKIFRFVVVLILFMFITGCTKSNNQTSEGEKNMDKISEDIKENKKDGDLIVSKEAEIDGIKIKINDVKKKKAPEEEEGDSEYEFVIVDITLTNMAEETKTYNPMRFQMEDINGNEKPMELTDINRKTALDSGELESGEKIRGTLVFLEPVGAKELKLVYYSKLLTQSKKVRFLII